MIVDCRAVGVVVTCREVTELRQQQENMRKEYEFVEQKTAELAAVIERMPRGGDIATPDANMRSNHVDCARD